MLKLFFVSLVAGVLMLSRVELSCVAAAHPRAPETGSVGGAIPPDLPGGSETDTVPSASPLLTL